MWIQSATYAHRNQHNRAGWKKNTQSRLIWNIHSFLTSCSASFVWENHHSHLFEDLLWISNEYYFFPICWIFKFDLFENMPIKIHNLSITETSQIESFQCAQNMATSTNLVIKFNCAWNHCDSHNIEKPKQVDYYCMMGRSVGRWCSFYEVQHQVI